MTRALALAERGAGAVHPNPLVGAVVAIGDRVVGEGWHAAFGGPHAEVHALEAAGTAARGATLYVTLEPCAHHGKTPPCVEAVLAAGIARVVVAMQDPDPRVNGRSLSRLESAGVAVDVGVGDAEARSLNAPFIQFKQRGRSLVTIKLAASLDGRIAGPGGDARWITSRAARADGHALRARADAVLVGSGTARHDDPSLSVRHVEGRDPVRIVLDSRARLPRTLKMFQDAGPRTVVATLEAAHGAAAESWTLPSSADGRVDLEALFRRTAEEGLLHVLVEAGPTLAGTLLTRDLCDELVLYTAPIVVGGPNDWARALEGREVPDARRLRTLSLERVGEDVRTRLVTPSHPSWDTAPVGARDHVEAT